MKDKQKKDDFPDAVEKVNALLCEGDSVRKSGADVIREVPFAVRLNGRHMATLACAGIHLRELAIGHLYAEGWIGDRNDIESIRVTKSSATVRTRQGTETGGTAESHRPAPLIGSSGARMRSGRKPKLAGAESDAPVISPGKVSALMRALLASTVLHEATRGTHCSGIADRDRLLASREDIGRHNTLDMLAGLSVLGGLDLSDKILLTTGRISSEMVSKAAGMGISFIISHSAPTSEAVASAARKGMTLACSVRGKKTRVYAHGKRIAGVRPGRAKRRTNK